MSIQAFIEEFKEANRRRWKDNLDLKVDVLKIREDYFNSILQMLHQCGLSLEKIK